MKQGSIRHHERRADAAMRRVVGASFVSHSRRMAQSGLMGHMRAAQRRNRRVSHWLAIAVVAGAFVALAFVGYLSR